MSNNTQGNKPIYLYVDLILSNGRTKAAAIDAENIVDIMMTDDGKTALICMLKDEEEAKYYETTELDNGNKAKVLRITADIIDTNNVLAVLFRTRQTQDVRTKRYTPTEPKVGIH